jgi:hypothetical protein
MRGKKDENITWRVPPVDDNQIRVPNQPPEIIPIPDMPEIPGVIIESERRRREQQRIPEKPGIPVDGPQDIYPPQPNRDEGSVKWRMRTADSSEPEKSGGRADR